MKRICFLGYSKKNTKLISYLRKKKFKVTDQGINIIFTAVAMFEKIRKWNRKNIKNYFEIYVKVSIKNIRKKNKKNLYKSKKINVVGKDIRPEYPKNPDLIVKNNYKKNLNFLVKKILTNLV